MLCMYVDTEGRDTVCGKGTDFISTVACTYQDQAVGTYLLKRKHR